MRMNKEILFVSAPQLTSHNFKLRPNLPPPPKNIDYRIYTVLQIGKFSRDNQEDNRNGNSMSFLIDIDSFHCTVFVQNAVVFCMVFFNVAEPDGSRRSRN